MPWLLAFALLLGFLQLLAGETPPVPAKDAPYNSARVFATNSIIPKLPNITSPIDYFRKLLGQNAAERELALASKPPEQRAKIEAKIREYEKLTPRERENRFAVLELKWYLMPIISGNVTNRENYIQRIPNPALQKIINKHVQDWDSLPPKLQHDIIQSHSLNQFFYRIQMTGSITAIDSQTIRPPLPPEAPQNKVSQDEWLSSMNRFFGLSESEKRQTLKLLPANQRAKALLTINSIGKLEQEERRKALILIRRLSNMQMEQRQQFLTNVHRWKTMSGEEKTNWVRLCAKLPPPSSSMLPPAPPLPASDP